MDGDLDGSGHRDHTGAQLGVPDGDPRPGWPGNRAGAQQPGGLAAQARERVRRQPGVTGQRCAGATSPALIACCSAPIESLT
jgi:hypothetical protein